MSKLINIAVVGLGQMVVGQKVKIPPLQKSLKIKEIITYDGNLQRAQKGDAVTIRLNENVDVTRGRVIVDEKDEVKIAEKNKVNLEFEASVAGGIPILRSIKEGLATNKISKVYGILNGTSNYILNLDSEQLGLLHL